MVSSGDEKTFKYSIDNTDLIRSKADEIAKQITEQSDKMILKFLPTDILITLRDKISKELEGRK